ncbi:NUDIX domain-containing protein [Amycolatopsis cihanbeyliensis]|uniref:ADP-ribose pyrophosphatase n=1 Tax=Amycolatopsis cihanbeyliensis TaxID=1128664 RepID=A0A542DI60_AMYCI|nr:NUDIX domain-containing protein [Amycolatopsis cihanbeyliensis]TQJ02787.1 ADP-ribose pyrophosphatase [Amycolatopsis cihanbeyliensis]
MAWQLLESEVVHSTPWFDVRSDLVIRPDGARDVYSHVVTPGSVTVLALHQDDSVVLTRQWIYTHGGTEWRLPGGVIDAEDADPAAAARRELAEETGLRAGNWHKLGIVHGADSMSNHVDHLFLATGLTTGTPAPDRGESDLRVRRLAFPGALSLVRNGQLPHAGSGHALLLTALRRAETG